MYICVKVSDLLELELWLQTALVRVSIAVKRQATQKGKHLTGAGL